MQNLSNPQALAIEHARLCLESALRSAPENVEYFQRELRVAYAAAGLRPTA